MTGEPSRLPLSNGELIMNLRTTAARRLLSTGALACAVALVPAAALAAPGGTVHAGRTATPACATSGLDIWLNTQGSGAAGTIYYNLEFTNLSGSTCTLFGYPGVSGTNLTGTQLGSAAVRIGATPQTVTLANGATTTALVGIVEGGIFPPAQCGPVTAAGLRVFPPGQTQSKRVPFPFAACSKTGPQYLKIMPVQ
jgi:Protein of unknown function (DUF4232)